jgi:RNAse (barnase) inhibitor barstar
MGKVFVIDGKDFSTLEGFYSVIGNTLITGQPWGENLDAFNDILYWPVQGSERYTIVWKNSTLSRERLAYAETVRQLERRVRRCHPTNVPFAAQELEAAKRGEGPTVFDRLVDIIKSNNEYVELRLG